jgi:hypothetical protein
LYRQNQYMYLIKKKSILIMEWCSIYINILEYTEYPLKKHFWYFNILKCTEYPSKTISDSPSANPRPLFNNNVTKVYVMKWSQKWSRAIRIGVFGIAKIFKITCFACIFQKKWICQQHHFWWSECNSETTL